MRPCAIILIGCTGSGTSFFSHCIADRFEQFVVFRKITTRKRRKHERDGVDYCFVDQLEFDDLIRGDELLHVKRSDFDNAMYGVEKKEVGRIIKKRKYPIFTCHSLEESQTLALGLSQLEIKPICIYIYSKEAERENALLKNCEIPKYAFRLSIDLTFKIQAYETKFVGCNYLLLNRYDGRESISRMDEIISSIKIGSIPRECNFESVSQEIGADIQRIKRQISLPT